MSSISSISASIGTGFSQSAQQPSFRDLFKQLESSLSSGDITGAQSSLSKLSQIVAKRESASGNSTPSPLAEGLSQISSDLQSGNLQQAQTDFSSVKSAFQAHNNGGVNGAFNNAPPPPPPPPSNDGKSGGPATAKPGNNLVSSLLLAIQDFLNSVQNDLNSSNTTSTDSSVASSSGNSASTSGASSSGNNLAQNLEASLQNFLKALEADIQGGINANSSSNPYSRNGAIYSFTNTNSQSFLNITS